MVDMSSCFVHVELPVKECVHQISELMKTGGDEPFQNRAVSEMLAWKKNDLFSHKKGVREENVFVVTLEEKQK